MKNQLVKKLRKFAAKNYKLTLNEALDTVCKENILHRLIFAFKVVFKIYKIKNKSKSTIKTSASSVEPNKSNPAKSSGTQKARNKK